MADVALPAFNVLSLFTGIAGLDLGIHRAVSQARSVCYVEREAYAAAILATRIKDGLLDDAPIWSDVSTFDGKPWRGVVDCIVGGFPCQDISNAGKREGIGGERSGLWREFARIIDEVRPGYVFVENVAALANRGLDVVLGDLAALGFDAEWDVFRACDVGAPHIRRRLFILADAKRGGHGGRTGLKERSAVERVAFERAREVLADSISTDLRNQSGGAAGRTGAVRPSLETLAHSDRWGCEQQRIGGIREVGNAQPGDDVDGCSDTEVANAESNGRDEGRTERERQPPRSATPSRRDSAFPPGPSDHEEWSKWNGPQPGVRRGANGISNRMERLRCLGNGVVPGQAELAWQTLNAR